MSAQAVSMPSSSSKFDRNQSFDETRIQMPVYTIADTDTGTDSDDDVSDARSPTVQSRSFVPVQQTVVEDEIQSAIERNDEAYQQYDSDDSAFNASDIDSQHSSSTHQREETTSRRFTKHNYDGSTEEYLFYLLKRSFNVNTNEFPILELIMLVLGGKLNALVGKAEDSRNSLDDNLYELNMYLSGAPFAVYNDLCKIVKNYLENHRIEPSTDEEKDIDKILHNSVLPTDKNVNGSNFGSQYGQKNDKTAKDASFNACFTRIRSLATYIKTFDTDTPYKRSVVNFSQKLFESLNNNHEATNKMNQFLHIHKISLDGQSLPIKDWNLNRISLTDMIRLYDEKVKDSYEHPNIYLNEIRTAVTGLNNDFRSRVRSLNLDEDATMSSEENDIYSIITDGIRVHPNDSKRFKFGNSVGPHIMNTYTVYNAPFVGYIQRIRKVTDHIMSLLKNTTRTNVTQKFYGYVKAVSNVVNRNYSVIEKAHRRGIRAQKESQTSMFHSQPITLSPSQTTTPQPMFSVMTPEMQGFMAHMHGMTPEMQRFMHQQLYQQMHQLHM